MKTVDELLQHIPDFKNCPTKEKVLLIIYLLTVNGVKQFAVKDVYAVFTDNGLQPPSNISRELQNLTKEKPAHVIFKAGKYYLEITYKTELDRRFGKNSYTKQTTEQLSRLLPLIQSDIQRAFLEDAVKCFNAALYRPAIIMTWLLTMDTLYDHLLNNYRDVFNQQLEINHKKIKIKSKDDFESYKENDVIGFMKAINMLSKEQAKLLTAKLDSRNSAAHPNGTSFKEAKVATFIEELIEDIISKFQ